MSTSVYAFPTAGERLCSVGARAPVPVGGGLSLPGEVDLLVVIPDLAVRFQATIEPGIVVTFTEPPRMSYDCLRYAYTPETFRSLLATALSALARRGIETVPASKGRMCPVDPHDPLTAAIVDMLGPESAQRIAQLRTALRVQAEARTRQENVARAVARTLFVSERQAHRLLRRARELGLGPADAVTSHQAPADTTGAPDLPPLLWH